MKLSLTYFESLTNPQGKRVTTSWETLVGRLSMARTVERKHDAPGISLATYAGDRRALVNVERVFAIGLDLDERVNWDDLTTRFSATTSFLHTTWSSTEAEPRARVFLPLSRPVTGDEYRRVYAACVLIVESGGLVVDRAASDPSRFWFLPSTPPGAAYHYSIGRGPVVNVDDALRAVPAPIAPVAPARHDSDRNDTHDVEARAAAYLDRCEPAISGSGGSTVTFKLAVKMTLGFGLDEATAYRLMCRWNERCSPPWSERDLRKKIRDAAERGTMPEGALRDARKAS